MNTHSRSAMLVCLAIILSIGAMLAALSFARYTGYNAGMLDLGNMAQAIASVLRGRPLVFTYVDGATSRLSLHVELFYLLLVPVYALWPDPRSLLLAQTALFALGALPAYQLARRSLNSDLAGFLVALIYLLYPVGQTAVLFDLHGDTLALPMLMFALEALDRRAWRRYVLFVALALSCKFYVAAPIAVLGLVIWRRYNERRVALLTVASPILYGAIAFLIIRPFFTTGQTSEAHRGLNYVSFYFGQFAELFATWYQRLFSAVAVFGPALFLAWRGWIWLIPAFPLTAAALLSTGPGGSYDYRYHHYAVVVPFVIMAIIEGARQVRERLPKRNWKADLGFVAVIVLSFNLALIDTPLNPGFWLGGIGRGLDPSIYGNTSRDRLKDQFLAEHVPPGVSLITSIFLASHLVERDTLYLIRYPDDPGGQRLPELLPRVEYALADGLFDFRLPINQGVSNGPDYERAEIALLLRDPAFALVEARDGLLLFQRDPPPERILPQEITIRSETPATTLAAFGPIELVSATFQPLDGRRYQAEFSWKLSAEAPPGARLAAISRLSTISDARILHLPTYALLSPLEWQPDHLVEERFVIELPDHIAPGSYDWQVAWYDLSGPAAYATDERSLAFNAPPVTIGTLVVP